MSLTTEQLMYPRYKVVAEYPGSLYPIGFVIELTESVVVTDYEANTKKTEFAQRFNIGCNESWFERYPAIFQPVNWADEREIEDLPDYVKIATDCTVFYLGAVFEVDKWMPRNNRAIIECETVWPPDLLPATQSEYITYKTQPK